MSRPKVIDGQRIVDINVAPAPCKGGHKGAKAELEDFVDCVFHANVTGDFTKA